MNHLDDLAAHLTPLAAPLPAPSVAKTGPEPAFGSDYSRLMQEYVDSRAAAPLVAPDQLGIRRRAGLPAQHGLRNRVRHLEPAVKTRAYLVQSHEHEAVTIDHQRAIDQATQHRGIIRHLVLRDDAANLLATIESIQALASQQDAARNIPLIREACARVLES